MKKLLRVFTLVFAVSLWHQRNLALSAPKSSPVAPASHQPKTNGSAPNKNSLWAKQSEIRYSVFSPDKKRVFIACYGLPDQQGQVWDTSNHWACNIELPSFEKRHPFFSPDGSLLCVPNFTFYTGFVDDQGTDFRNPIDSDWNLEIFDARFGKKLRSIHLSFKGHRDYVNLYWKGNSIVCVTRQETRRFNPISGKLIPKHIL